MRRLAAILAIATMAVGPSALAHPTTSFRACTKHVGPEPCFSRGAAFLFGDVVVIRGRIDPSHGDEEARVLRLAPHAARWRVVGTVEVSSTGVMTFRWRTDENDAVQDAPYRFRFRIPGHGASRSTEAFVLFGE